MSIRLSYADLDGNGKIESGSEILEEKNYYPFGLQHDGYNMGVRDERSVEAEQIKYNGKEFEDSFGLNMYEMDLRQYDPAIGRWLVQDPVVHHDFSPYSAFDNNPVYWADPSGADSQTSGNNIDKLLKDSEHGDTYGMEGGKLSYSGKQTEAQIKQTYEMSSLNEGNGGGNGNGGEKNNNPTTHTPEQIKEINKRNENIVKVIKSMDLVFNLNNSFKISNSITSLSGVIGPPIEFGTITYKYVNSDKLVNHYTKGEYIYDSSGILVGVILGYKVRSCFWATLWGCYWDNYWYNL